MPTPKPHSNRTMILVMGTVTLILGACAYSFYSAVREFQHANEQQRTARTKALQALMPTVPTNFTLTTQGFNPKAHCLDKCGHEYRTYQYPSNETVCQDIRTGLKVDARGLILDHENDPDSSCEARLGKAIMSQKNKDFTLKVKRAAMPDVHTYLNVVIDTSVQKVMYTVGEELFRPST